MSAERKAPPPDEQYCRLVWNTIHDAWDIMEGDFFITRKISVVRRYAVQRWEEIYEQDATQATCKNAVEERRRCDLAEEQIEAWKEYR